MRERNARGLAGVVAAFVGLICMAAAVGVEDQPQLGEQKLARVGGKDITRRDVDIYVAAFLVTPEMREQLDPRPAREREEFYGAVRRKALEDVIERAAIVQQAREDYLENSKTPDLLDQIVDREQVRLTDKFGSRLKLHTWLRRQGLSLMQWRGLMADQILHEHYLRQEIRSRVRVSPDRMRAYHATNAERFRVPLRIVYRIILVDPAGCKDAAEELAKAQGILAELRGGADFAEMADKRSLDREKYPGGLRDVQAPPTAPDWMPPPCVGLKAGEISEIKTSEAGCSIAKLEEVVPSHVPAFEKVQSRVRAALEAQEYERLKGELLARLRRSRAIEYMPAGRKLLLTGEAPGN